MVIQSKRKWTVAKEQASQTLNESLNGHTEITVIDTLF